MRNVEKVKAHGITMQIRVDDNGKYHTFYNDSLGLETGKVKRTLPAARQWARQCCRFWAGKA